MKERNGKKESRIVFLELFGNIKEDFCMEEKLVIPILFFFIVALGGICLLIFYFRKNDDSMYDWKMVTKYSELMREQTEENLDALSKMNKEKECDTPLEVLESEIKLTKSDASIIYENVSGQFHTIAFVDLKEKNRKM